jgi:hypothetical protein
VTDEPRSLGEHSAEFALEVQAGLDGVLPGERKIVSRKAPVGERYIVRPEGETVAERRMPIYVDGDHLADLGLSLYLDLDRTARYLKTVRSDITLHSVLDRTPLVRLDYRADMRTAPIAHWQFHAERAPSPTCWRTPINMAASASLMIFRAFTSPWAASASGLAWRTSFTSWSRSAELIITATGNRASTRGERSGGGGSSLRPSGTLPKKQLACSASAVGPSRLRTAPQVPRRNGRI